MTNINHLPVTTDFNKDNSLTPVVSENEFPHENQDNTPIFEVYEDEDEEQNDEDDNGEDEDNEENNDEGEEQNDEDEEQNEEDNNEVDGDEVEEEGNNDEVEEQVEENQDDPDERAIWKFVLPLLSSMLLILASFNTY